MPVSWLSKRFQYYEKTKGIMANLLVGSVQNGGRAMKTHDGQMGAIDIQSVHNDWTKPTCLLFYVSFHCLCKEYFTYSTCTVQFVPVCTNSS
jgi:hypothetical protein